MPGADAYTGATPEILSFEGLQMESSSFAFSIVLGVAIVKGSFRWQGKETTPIIHEIPSTIRAAAIGSTGTFL